MNPERKAKGLLIHYFELTAGGTWNFDGDNQAEIEEIVSLIIRASIQATREEMREEIIELKARINDLESNCN